MNKKSSVFMLVVSAALIGCFFILMLQLHSDSLFDLDTVLSGHSDHWDVYINMVDGGTTEIVMGPAVRFDYPDCIEIELGNHDQLLYRDKLFIQRQQNSYTLKFSTVKSAYRHAAALTFVVYYNNVSEKVTLHEEPS